MISSENTDDFNCRHITINSNNELSLFNINLDTDNSISIDSFSNGHQILIFNTNYNGVESNQFSFTIDLDHIDLLGDLNDDGEINVVDAIIIVNMILDEQYDSLADLNEDEAINIMDIVLLINIILN